MSNDKFQIPKDESQFPMMEGASVRSSFRSAEIVGPCLFCSALSALFGAGMTCGEC